MIDSPVETSPPIPVEQPELPSLLQPESGRHDSVEWRTNTIKTQAEAVTLLNKIVIEPKYSDDYHFWFILQQEYGGLTGDKAKYYLLHPNATKLNPEERRELDTISAIRTAKKLYDSEKLRATDPLTGAWSRGALDNRIKLLQKEMASDGKRINQIPLLFIDIDNFKSFNDFYGHNIGDTVLQKLVERMQDRSRAISDMVARYGGEEFCILAPTASDNADAFAIRAEEIRQKISEKFTITINGKEVPITISMGLIFITDPKEVLRDEHETTGIYHRASKELKNAKNGGRNCGYYDGKRITPPSPPPFPTPSSPLPQTIPDGRA